MAVCDTLYSTGRQAGKQADCSSSLPFYMRKTSRQAIYSRFYSEIFNDSIIAVCICTAPEILILLTRVQLPVEPTSNFLPLTFFIFATASGRSEISSLALCMGPTRRQNREKNRGQKKCRSGSTEIRTPVKGFKVPGANQLHYRTDRKIDDFDYFHYGNDYK